jgi:hypothetical protein
MFGQKIRSAVLCAAVFGVASVTVGSSAVAAVVPWVGAFGAIYLSNGQISQSCGMPYQGTSYYVEGVGVDNLGNILCSTSVLAIAGGNGPGLSLCTGTQVAGHPLTTHHPRVTERYPQTQQLYRVSKDAPVGSGTPFPTGTVVAVNPSATLVFPLQNVSGACAGSRIEATSIGYLFPST